jgi:uncharacterized protein (TIGR02270 family)
MNLAILERHKDELSFLWSLRDAAVRSPRHDLCTLGELDERLDAHLDGLRVGGEAGFALVREPAEAGVAFAAAALGAERGEDLAALGALAEDPAMARGMVAGLGWIAADRAAAVAPLLSAGAASARALAVAGLAAHRRDPGGALDNAVLDPHPWVRARALRAAGEIGRVDLLPALLAARSDGDEACRFWAAWSAALLGAAASPELWDFAESAGPFAERAMRMAARRTEPRAALDRLTALAARPEHARVAILGAAALGDPGAAPWLVAQLEDPALARLAAEALAMIGGVGEGLAGPKPAEVLAGPSDDPADEVVAMDPDAERPWPAPVALAAAFRARDLRRGSRYLRGLPITAGHAERVLREGRQHERAAAAIERSLLAPGRPLYEVRAPAFRQ